MQIYLCCITVTKMLTSLHVRTVWSVALIHALSPVSITAKRESISFFQRGSSFDYVFLVDEGKNDHESTRPMVAQH